MRLMPNRSKCGRFKVITVKLWAFDVPPMCASAMPGLWPAIAPASGCPDKAEIVVSIGKTRSSYVEDNPDIQRLSSIAFADAPFSSSSMA